MKKVKCFMRDESVAHPGKWRIIPIHDNFHYISTLLALVNSVFMFLVDKKKEK